MRTRSYILSLVALAFAGLFTGSALADDTLIETPSPHSVSQTMDRLEQAVEEAGATVFARIDHQKGGRTVGMDIPDNELLIFGNPRLGTPVIRDAPAAGLDLPIRVVAVETPDGTVLIYRAPAAVAQQFGLAPDHPSIALMSGALKNLTAKAAEE